MSAYVTADTRMDCKFASWCVNLLVCQQGIGVFFYNSVNVNCKFSWKSNYEFNIIPLGLTYPPFNSSLTDAFDTCRHLTCELSKSSEMSNLLLQAKYCINSQTTWMVQPPIPLLSGFMHIIVEYLIFSVILTKTSRLCVFDRPSVVPRLLIIFWSYYWSFGYHEFKIDVI